ncbi:MAG: aldehyde dehydrogenase family protein [Gammaproteobacteria bacterium]|nr:aldehyde dehydrogenase family protein [Gammaproteobacteria bacterium]
MSIKVLAMGGDGIGPEVVDAATQSPVGGFKQSGYGRENGFEGMRCFIQTKSVWLATDPKQPDPFPA